MNSSSNYPSFSAASVLFALVTTYLFGRILISAILFVFLIQPNICFSSPSPDLLGKAIISNVVDGDTFWLRVLDRENVQLFRALTKGKHIRDGNKVKIRLLGIDTEESAHLDPAKNTEFGRETSRFVKNLLTNRSVSYHCRGAGHYDRPLCSISVDGADVGEFLIREGYSKYITRFGQHPWFDAQYRAAEIEAKKERTGVWR